MTAEWDGTSLVCVALMSEVTGLAPLNKMSKVVFAGPVPAHTCSVVASLLIVVTSTGLPERVADPGRKRTLAW